MFVLKYLLQITLIDDFNKLNVKVWCLIFLLNLTRQKWRDYEGKLPE